MQNWYKYDNNIVNLVKFMKWNTNSMLIDFQKTASILFYVDVKYVSVCHNNLCNNNEVIDIMGHNHPPVIDQSQDATSSSSSSNTSSSLSSYVSSSSLSNNSSRSLTSVRLKTNSDNNSLFLSSSQSTKNCRSNSVDIARQWQAWRLRTKIVTKFMSYVLQTPRLQKPENLRIV
jgi:hypothetical protein